MGIEGSMVMTLPLIRTRSYIKWPLEIGRSLLYDFYCRVVKEDPKENGRLDDNQYVRGKSFVWGDGELLVGSKELERGWRHPRGLPGILWDGSKRVGCSERLPFRTFRICTVTGERLVRCLAGEAEEE